MQPDLTHLSGEEPKYVEKPFRNPSNIKTNYLFTYLGIIILLIVAVLSYAIVDDGVKNRFSFGRYNPEPMFSDKERGEYSEKYNEENILNKIKVNSDDGNKSVNVLIIGNSHGVGLYNAFALNNYLFPKKVFARSSTQLFLLADRFEKIKKTSMFELADVIMIATKWSAVDISRLQEVIESIHGERKKVVVVLNRPQFNYNIESSHHTPIDRFVVDSEISDSRWSSNTVDLQEKFGKFFYKIMEKHIDVKNESILNIISDYDNVIVLNPFDYSCSHNSLSCDVVTPEGEKIYYDSSPHYTLAGSKFFGEKIAASDGLNF